MIHEKVVKAVEAILLMPEALGGYVSVLEALSVLMSNNTNDDTKKAGLLVENLAIFLDDYLSEDEDEDDDQ